MPSRDFSRRAFLTEWMDGSCTEQELREYLDDLEQVNRFVMTHRPTLQWLGKIAGMHRGPMHIVDVGCGGGDMLRVVERWASRRSLDVKLTGVDLNESAIRFARERTNAKSCIRYVQGHAAGSADVRNVDIIISSHMTHHLSDSEILSFLKWMDDTARAGWFINDLHRSAFGYHAFQLLARCMRWHRFIRHDGPISVQRSFRREDWKRYIAAAGTTHVSIQAFLPGRLCVERTKHNA